MLSHHAVLHQLSTYQACAHEHLNSLEANLFLHFYVSYVYKWYHMLIFIAYRPIYIDQFVIW